MNCFDGTSLEELLGKHSKADEEYQALIKQMNVDLWEKRKEFETWQEKLGDARVQLTNATNKAQEALDSYRNYYQLEKEKKLSVEREDARLKVG